MRTLGQEVVTQMRLAVLYTRFLPNSSVRPVSLHAVSHATSASDIPACSNSRTAIEMLSIGDYRPAQEILISLFRMQSSSPVSLQKKARRLGARSSAQSRASELHTITIPQVFACLGYCSYYA